MNDAPPRRHAAAGNDDHRAITTVQRLGFLDRMHKLRRAVQRFALGRRQPVLTRVPAEDLCGIHRHRTVEEHRDVRDEALPFQLAQAVQHGLRAPDGK